MNSFFIPLMFNNIERDDIDCLITFLQQNSIPKLTNGPKVLEFERAWSEWLGIKHSLFVNSGSSANQLTIALLKGVLGPGEIIVPPLTWVSDIAAVIQNDFTPVFCDINLQNLSFNLDQLKKKITSDTKAIFVTHVLGINALTDELLEICQKNNIALVEDCCESYGATFKGKKIGTFGEFSNFSFFYAHHMSVTPETPILYQNQNKLINIESIESLYNKYYLTPNSIKIASFDKEGKIKYVTPSSIIRHSLNNKTLFDIKTSHGRKVSLTGDHSIFIWEPLSCSVQSKKGNQLKKGDLLVVPYKLPETSETILELDFRGFCFKNSPERFWVRNSDKRNFLNKEYIHMDNSVQRGNIPLKYIKFFSDSDLIGVSKQREHCYIPAKVKITKDFCKLLGLFIAEGSYKEKYSLSFSFHEKEVNLQKFVKKSIQKIFNLKTAIIKVPKDKSCVVNIYSSALYVFFREFLGIEPGAKLKRIPQIIFNVSSEYKLSFLEGCFLGDGSCKGNGSRVSSASKLLINDISYLASFLGIWGKTSYETGKEKIIKGKETKSSGIYHFTLANLLFSNDGFFYNSKLKSKFSQSNQKCLNFKIPFLDKEKGKIVRRSPNYILKYVQKFENYPTILNLINNDLMILPIEEITVSKEQPEFVYDFSVPQFENFIGGFQPVCLHNSTIEGGMICTNDDTCYQYLRCLRSHGMLREATDESLKERYLNLYPSLNPDFVFIAPAYNMRSTEINAVLGLNQLKKLDNNNLKRKENFEYFIKILDKNKYIIDLELEGQCNYAFIVILKNPNFEKRNEIEKLLRENKIEFRRGLSGGGSQIKQPYIKQFYTIDEKEFPVTEHIHHFSWYIGNYPSLEKEKIDKLLLLLNNI